MTTYPFYVQIALLLSVGMLSFVVFHEVLRRGGARPWFVGAIALGVVAVWNFAVNPMIAEHTSVAADTVAFRGFRIVEFARRPNVYVLGFDGLVPPRLYDTLLGLGVPPTLAVVKRHGGFIVPNLFADEVPTIYFWARMMGIVDSSENRLAKEDVILGRVPSALLATFQGNGYQTHFSYWTGYFGANKGRYLTSYEIHGAYSGCSLLDDLPSVFGFFGYCLLQEARLLPFAPPPEPSSDTVDDFYLDRVRTIARAAASSPQFLAAHYPEPRHAPLRYRRTAEEFEAFRHEYATNTNRAAAMMDAMLTEIQASDPTAIVFVVGDHGSWLSRGLQYTDDPEFVVRDRHGIFGALFGAEDCLPHVQPREGQRTQTSSQVMVGLLQCLAGGVSPLTGEFDFGRISQAPGNMRFEDYAYE